MMTRAIRRGLGLAALGFVLLFGLRLGYGYLATPRPSAPASSGATSGGNGGFEFEKKNYASVSVTRQPSAGPAIDQKYEQVGDVRVRSVDFPTARQAVDAAIAAHAGVVQFERRTGLAGRRNVDLAIGVAPDHFEPLIDALGAVGVIELLTVDKHDRTSAFRELAARRDALLETRAAVVALKERATTIEQQLEIEDRLQDTLGELRTVALALGVFDDANAFCTVKFSLREVTPTAAPRVASIPWWQRAKVALEWTVPLYLPLLGAAALGVALALGLALLAVRLRIIRAAMPTQLGKMPHAAEPAVHTIAGCASCLAPDGPLASPPSPPPA
jgi:hypothetical protein